jgi:type I restriction enzyme M protein
MIWDALSWRDESAPPVIKNVCKDCTVKYEPDSELREIEQIPLLEEGGINAFFQREVLPYIADAWIDHSKTVIGYEILFSQYFYKYTPPRDLGEIITDIRRLEDETEGLLDSIIRGANG